ncbi:hypothetical protein Ancab_012167 [Ancistrocladus abbreviatus]
MLALVGQAGEMEQEFDSKLRIKNNPSTNDNGSGGRGGGGGSSNEGSAVQRGKSFQFRAPQVNFTIQDFELGKIYGVGSYSKVVRAKKKDTGVIYALKIMDKEFITKENKTSYVKLERIVLDQLDHPGIVRLYFTFQDSFSLYMALESCEGGELFDQITRKGRLSEDEARFYAAEVVDALEYIHGLGLIHRDIKPENLLLTADGHIKIADFGSVKPMQDSSITVLPNAASDDKACTFVGTAAYVPPEVLNSSPATFGQQFLDPGESVLMISMVKKMQKLSSKKVQLILTNKPKLIYVDPSKLVVKGNIIWSDNPNDLSIQVTSPSSFKICTPKKVMMFEDPKQRAWQWKKAIEGLQNQ